MSEQFINAVLNKLYQKVDDSVLSSVKMALILSLEHYEVTEKCTDLVPTQRSMPECYTAFIIAKKIEGGSEHSIRTSSLQITKMFYTLNKDIKEITTNDIRAYLYHLQQQTGIMNSSLDTIRSILMAFFSWSAAEGYLDKNPMITIKPIKSTSKVVEPFNDYELEKLRLACKDVREQLIIELFATTGCRVSELANIQLSNIDWATGAVKIIGKGNKERFIYLNAKTSLFIEKYLRERKVGEDTNSLFLGSRYPCKRLDTPAVEKIVKQIGARAGVNDVHCHRLRHTFATNMIKRGVPVTHVQKMLGHSNINTTMIYAKIEDSDIRIAHEKFMN